MKRDLDLVRKILLNIEENPEADGDSGLTVEVEGYTDRLISYHIELLNEAGLLVALDGIDAGWVATRLTNEGHEFLDASRDETLWARAKRFLAEKGPGTGLEVLKAVSVKLVTDTAFGA